MNWKTRRLPCLLTAFGLASLWGTATPARAALDDGPTNVGDVASLRSTALPGPLFPRAAGPLAVKLTGKGDLILSGKPTGDVEINGTADDQVEIKEGGASLGVFSVPGDLKVNLSDVDGPIIVNVALAGFTMSGSWKFTLGDAPGYFLTIGNGTIQGAVRVKSGNGNDQVSFGSVGPASIGGKVTIDTGDGMDFVLFPSFNSDLGSDLKVLNAQFVASDNPFHVAGKMTIKSAREALVFTLAMGVHVDGNVSITTGPNPDVLRFNEDSVLGGNLKVNLGDGGDQFDLGSGIGPSGDTSIGGKVSVKGGLGDDLVRLGGATDAAILSGKFSFTGGAGEDTLRIGLSSASGDVTMNGQGGNDTLVTAGLLTAPTAKLSFQGGSEDDVVDFTASLPDLQSALLNGGSGTNTYLPNASPIGYPIQIVNFN